MSLATWLRSWKRTKPMPRRHTRTSARRPASFRPRMEALEDRALFSATPMPYPTATTVDQLIADINYADATGGAFTINLSPGTTFDVTGVNNSTNGANGLPIIGGTKAVQLTIFGNGDTVERVGTQAFRLFDVAPGASLTLDHVTVRQGSAGSGGAIYNQGALTLSTSLLSDNSATSGGGIYNFGGTVTIDGSTLANNLADWGGGIWNAGTLTVEYSTLSGNTGDDLSTSGGYGGGIYNNGGTVTVSDSTLSSNTADIFAYSMRGGNGGAIYNAGGTVTLDNSDLTGNAAFVGGGLYNDPNGTVTVKNFSNINWSNSVYSDLSTEDVYNAGVLYLDSTSTIGVLSGNAAIPFDPNAPQLQIRDVTVTEGNTGTVAAKFTVTLSAASTATVTVSYATADGSATAGSDYQAASGTLSFAPGETSKVITVLVNGDRLGESDETFLVNLTGATNASLVDGHGVGTIVDDEPHVSIGDVTKQEGKRGQATQFTFTVALSTSYDQPVTMSFLTTNGTAKSGDDYIAKSGTLTFAAGETTKTITITVNGDNKKEADETFYLDLFGNSGNSLFSKSRGIGTILNDD